MRVDSHWRGPRHSFPSFLRSSVPSVHRKVSLEDPLAARKTNSPLHPALPHRRPGRSTPQVRPSQCPAWPLSTSSHLLRSQLLRTSTGMQRSAAYTKVVGVLPGGKKHLLSSNLCDDLGSNYL